MSNEIPVEVYEELFKLNRQLLNDELDKPDISMNMVYQRFNRMVHALDYVENYKLQRAREGKL